MSLERPRSLFPRHQGIEAAINDDNRLPARTKGNLDPGAAVIRSRYPPCREQRA